MKEFKEFFDDFKFDKVFKRNLKPGEKISIIQPKKDEVPEERRKEYIDLFTEIDDLMEKHNVSMYFVAFDQYTAYFKGHDAKETLPEHIRKRFKKIHKLASKINRNYRNNENNEGDENNDEE